jgi:hypothetical protein
MLHYTCPRELVPVIESALAAKGYVVELPLQIVAASIRITVMTRGNAVVSLHERGDCDMAEIRFYNHNEPDGLEVMQLLPSLCPPPLRQRRQHASSM